MTLYVSDWPMDIDLARTFLEIVRCGSLAAAAEKLHVTQTAITARVQASKAARASAMTGVVAAWSR